MIYKKKKGIAYNIHVIKTDRFKKCKLEINFQRIIKKDTITGNALLNELLTTSSSKHKTQKDLAIALENLYDASFIGITSKVGSSLITTFSFEFLNPKYCEDLSLKEFLSFPFDLLKNPNIKDNEFDKRMFNICRQKLASDIISLKDNPNKFAIVDTLKQMDNNSSISYQTTGYIEDLEKLNTKNIMDYYDDLLDNSICNIFLIGDVEPNEAIELLDDICFIRSVNDSKYALYPNTHFSKKVITSIKEEMYPQSILVMGYTLNKITKYEETYVLPILNSIFGGNGLESKLSKYLRGDNSLCYSSSSFQLKYDGILLLQAGINKDSYDKAIKLVKKAFKELSDHITDDELNNSKKNIINSLKTLEDNESAILNNYFFKELDNLPLYEERIEVIKNISKEDVYNLSKKMKLNIINFIKGVK